MIPLREYHNIDNNYVHAYSYIISDIVFTKKEFEIVKLMEQNIYMLLNKNRDNKNIFSVLPLNSKNYYADYYFGNYLKNSS